MTLDFDTCYRAVVSRDPRFDGRFFTGVTSTGIYCRPVCPARTPARRNMRFFPHAGAAEAAGFRACRRCRPETSPGSPDWNVRADLAARAVRLIADGYADEHGITGLARRLAVTDRHLRRLLLAELGTTPIALARTTRLQTARRLLAETSTPVTEIAFASGFSSVRQFNASFQDAYGQPPSALRTRTSRPGPRRGTGVPSQTGRGQDRRGQTGRARTDLPGRARPERSGEGRGSRGRGGRPRRHLAHPEARWPRAVRRAVPAALPCRPGHPGGGGGSRRPLRPHDPRPRRARDHRAEPAVGRPARRAGQAQVLLRARLTSLRGVGQVVSRCRQLFDLDAEPQAIAAALAADEILAPLVAARPGLRVPGAYDGFELAVRAVIGQQVSVPAARTLTGRLAARHGTPLPLPARPGRHADGAVPHPAGLADADLSGLGLTTGRQATLRALAAACASGRLTLDAGR